VARITRKFSGYVNPGSFRGYGLRQEPAAGVRVGRLPPRVGFTSFRVGFPPSATTNLRRLSLAAMS